MHARFVRPLLILGLGAGTHTVHITVTGQPGCTGTNCGAYVDVDKLVIAP
jgi:hypothetical protein